MRRIFVDFEMQRADSDYMSAHPEAYAHEIIEIGAVALDDMLRETDCFKLYVRPSLGCIRPDIRALTGISDANISCAPGLERALSLFNEWIGNGEAEIFAWSDSDLMQLVNETRGKGLYDACRVGKLRRMWRDYQAEFSAILGLNAVVSLTRAITAMAGAFSGRAHDALADARNTAELYRIMQHEERRIAAAELLGDQIRRNAEEEAKKIALAREAKKASIKSAANAEKYKKKPAATRSVKPAHEPGAESAEPAKTVRWWLYRRHKKRKTP